MTTVAALATWIQRGPNPHADGMLPSIVDIRHHPTGAVVDNIEALCRAVLNGATPGLRERLEHADYDESLGYLLGQAAVIVDRYKPRDDKGSIGGWLKQELRWDLLDYWERVYGRQGQKRVVDNRLFDAAARDAGAGDADVDDRDPRVHRPGDAATTGAADAPGDRAFPSEWTDAVGDRGGARPAEGLGELASSGGAGGVDRRGAGADRRDGLSVAGPDRGAPAWVDCLSCSWRHYPWAPNGVPGWHFPPGCLSCGEPLADAA